MLHNTVRFTVYENGSTLKLSKFLERSNPEYLDYVDRLEQLVTFNEASYTRSSNTICYSLSDEYDQVYHSPVFNLSQNSLNQDADCIDEEALHNHVSEAIKALYKESSGSQKAILNEFLMNEMSIAFMQMFDNAEKRNIFQQFFNPGLIAVSPNYVIYELPPTSKLIEYYSTSRECIQEGTISRTEKIPLPWQVYVAIHDGKYNLIDTFMYFAKDSILKNGFKQPVFLPFMPNFYHNGLLCRPFYASYEDVSRYTKNIPGVMHASYDAVWNSGWNFDLYDAIMENTSNFMRNRHKNDFKNNLESKNLGSIYQNMLNSFANSSSPVNHFIYLISNINQLSPEDILSFPYASPSSQQVVSPDRDDWIREQYEIFIDNLDISEEEREDSSYVDELFQEYLSNISYPFSQEKSFADVLLTSVIRYCDDHYHYMFAQNEPSTSVRPSNEDTYSRLALYFQNNFSSK